MRFSGRAPLALFCVSVFSFLWQAPDGGGPALAQDGAANDSVVRAGEIQLEGKLIALDAAANTFVLEATSFTLPSGKTGKLSPPKPKTMMIDERTLIHVRGDAGRKVAASQLRAGIFALVIGADRGTGKPLPARRVAVWSSVEAGAFRFEPGQSKDAEPATPPAATPPANDAGGEEQGEAAAVPGNVLSQGSFEQVDAGGKLVGWDILSDDNVKLMKNNKGNRYALLSSGNRGQGHLFTNLPVEPSWKNLRVSARMRVSNLKVGKEAWETARVAVVFLDAQGKILTYGRQTDLSRDAAWVTVSTTSEVPPGTHRISIDVGVYAPQGEMAVDDISIVPNPPPDGLPIRPGLPEGSFEQTDAAGVPLGWEPLDRKRTQLVEEDGNHFLRLVNAEPRDGIFATGHFRLDPSWRALRIGVRMRTEGLRVGANPWENARLMYSFLDAAGTELKGDTATPFLTKDTDWVQLEVRQRVPAGAVFLKITPFLLQATGIADFDDITVEQLALP